MSFPEIVSLILLAVVALQMWFVRWVLKTSLATMKSCSETTDMATALSTRVLDQLAGVNVALPPQDRMGGA
jgi:hypothetical protein